MKKIDTFFGKPKFKFNSKSNPIINISYYKCNGNGNNPLIIDIGDSTNWSYSATYQFNSLNSLTQIFNYGDGTKLLFRAFRNDCIYVDNSVMFSGELIHASEVNIPIEIKILYKDDHLSFYKNGKEIWNKTNVRLDPSRYIYIGRASHAHNEGMDGCVSNVIVEHDKHSIPSEIELLNEHDNQLMENQQLLFNQLNMLNETLKSKNRLLELEIMELKSMNLKLMDRLEKIESNKQIENIESIAHVIEPIIAIPYEESV